MSQTTARSVMPSLRLSWLFVEGGATSVSVGGRKRTVMM